MRVGGPDVEGLDVVGHQLRAHRLRDGPEPAPRGLEREQHVVGDAEVGDDALALAVLAGERDLPVDRVPGAAPAAPGGAGLERPLVGGVGAEEQAGQLGAAGAQEPGDADDLALVELQVRGLEGAAATEADGGEQRRTALGGGARGVAVELVEHGEVAADHQLHELELGGRGDHALLDEPAVAQHRHAVGDGVDLVEEVGDEDDGDAVGAQPTHHLEELLHLVGVEARGGLVEDEHARLDVDGAGDRDELLHGDGVVAEGGPRVDVEPEALEGRSGLAVHGAVVDEAEPAGLAAQHHVLRDGQVRHQVDLLVDRADPGRLRRGGRGEVVGLAAHEDGAGVDRVDAGERLDERRLARTVLPHEGVDLTGVEAHRHVGEGLHGAERDRDVAHLHHGIGARARGRARAGVGRGVRLRHGRLRAVLGGCAGVVGA